MTEYNFPGVACVGMHFRGQQAVELIPLLDESSQFTLVREPENPYDAYAIKVIFNDVHLGYIERGQAAWISPLLDEGYSSEVNLTHKETRKNNLHPIFHIKLTKAND